jgi:hypothetical protein
VAAECLPSVSRHGKEMKEVKSKEDEAEWHKTTCMACAQAKTTAYHDLWGLTRCRVFYDLRESEESNKTCTVTPPYDLPVVYRIPANGHLSIKSIRVIAIGLRHGSELCSRRVSTLHAKRQNSSRQRFKTSLDRPLRLLVH